MDPLMVAGRVGEGVHLLLGDVDELAVSEVIAGAALQVGQAVDDCGHGGDPLI